MVRLTMSFSNILKVILLLTLQNSVKSLRPTSIPHTFKSNIQHRIVHQHPFTLYASRTRTTGTTNNKIDTNRNTNVSIFSGRRKWLGGVINPKDGSIYGIPSHANSILKISFAEDEREKEEVQTKIECIPLPRKISSKRRFKWLRGIIYDNSLFCIPSWSEDGILQIDLDTSCMHAISFPCTTLTSNNDDADDCAEEEDDRWKYHGGVLVTTSRKSVIYCIPSNANRVLKISCSSDSDDNIGSSCEYIGPTFKYMKNKWYGGVKGLDNAIYGIPYSSSHVLRISNDENGTEKVSFLGELSSDKYKWHGGVLSPRNGCIYGVPSHVNTVLKIDTTVHPPALSQLPIAYQVEENEDEDCVESKYKWGGTAIGVDDCIYGIPSNANSILKINPCNDEVTTFGNISLLFDHQQQSNSTTDNATIRKNKWQGAVLANDGWIYAIPCNANSIARVCTNPNTSNYNQVQLIDISFLYVDTGHTTLVTKRQWKDKYQGGFLGRDGNIYCIPENAHGILKIHVPQSVASDYGGNVIVELLA